MYFKKHTYFRMQNGPVSTQLNEMWLFGFVFFFFVSFCFAWSSTQVVSSWNLRIPKIKRKILKSSGKINKHNRSHYTALGLESECQKIFQEQPWKLEEMESSTSGKINISELELDFQSNTMFNNVSQNCMITKMWSQDKPLSHTFPEDTFT